MVRDSWVLSSAAAAPRGQQLQRGPQAKGSNRYETLACDSDVSDASGTSGPGHASSHRTPRSSGTTPGDTTAGAAARGAKLTAPTHARTGDSTQPSAGRILLIPSQLVGPGGAAAASQPSLPPPPSAPRGGGPGAQRTLMETVAPDAGTHRALVNVRTDSHATSGDLARSERGRLRSSGAAPKRDRPTSRSASRSDRPPVDAARKALDSSSRAAVASPVPGSVSRRRSISRPGPETRPPPVGGKPGGVRFGMEDGGEIVLPRRGEFADFVKGKFKSMATGNGGVSMSAFPFASSTDAFSPAHSGAPRAGARMRASSSWAGGARSVMQDFCIPDQKHVNPLTSSRLDADSHDIFLIYEVPAGAPNPLTKDNKDTSRPSERKRYHHFSTALLKTYNRAAPTYAALAAAGTGPFLAADHVDDTDGVSSASSGRGGSLVLPAPQALLFHQLSNESIVAVTMRFPTLSEASRVHATLSNSMPSGLNFANVNESAPHHHTLSRKPASNIDGTAPCFTLIDTIGLPVKGSDSECDAFSDMMLRLTPFGGAWAATSDSAVVEIIVSAITLVENHLIPTFGADKVDFSKDSIFVDVGSTKIEMVVLNSDSKHVCARCNSNCHRAKYCGRKARDMELKAKENAERKLRSAATAERERMSKLASLDGESATLINEILATTGVSNKAILNAMRSKMELLIRVTDVSVTTDGLVEASGLKRDVAEVFGKSLTAIASQRDFLSGVAALPASAPSASSLTASAAPPPRAAAASDESATSASDVSSALCAMEGVDEALISRDSTAASLTDAAVSKRPLDNTATSSVESPAKRRSLGEIVLAAPTAALAPTPLSLPDRNALLSVHGAGGIFAYFEGATRCAFGPELQPFPRVFNVDLVGDDAAAFHIGNAMYYDLAQFKSEVTARGASVEQVITSLPQFNFERVPYIQAGSLRIDGPSNALNTGVTIHDFNLSAGIFSTEEGPLFDETAFFRIDVELSKSAAASSVVSFKIGRTNPALAMIAAYFVQAAPRGSLWKAARVVRVAKPLSGALPLSPDHPALAAGGHASLAPVPPYGSTALLPHGAGGGVGQDGR